MHPLTIAIAQVVGSSLLSDLLKSFTPESGAAAVGERVRASTAIIPQLEAAARGETTPATEAAIGRLGREVTAYKQAYGTQARRQGIATTIPGRAGMERLEAARLGGVADILAKQQAAAQEQLIGLGTQALPMQREIEQGRRTAVQKGLMDVAGLFAESKLEREQGISDDRYDEMIEGLRAALMELLKGWQ